MLSPQQYVRQELLDAERRDATERAANDRRALASARDRGPNALIRCVHAVQATAQRLVRTRPDVAGEPHRSVVELTGDLDIQAAPAARRRFARAVDRSPDELVVDLGDVTSVDPAGIEVLMEAAAAMQGRRMRFTHARPEVEEAFEVAGLYDLVAAESQQTSSRSSSSM
jgi:anti-anti-sigma factor